MYAFGMLALLGLAVLIVARVGHRYVQRLPELWAFTLVALGMGTAWLADFDLFGAWNLAVRNDTIATTLTGFLVAGTAYFWHEVLHFLAGVARKFTDEAKVLEEEQHLRRVA
ncbi:hypothetical protein DI272_30190 [Streptomyces sp. Act143]|uniref:hypothetical protein n=1 Tax=Streptomyces sp. Act143 TaxID=2200760 RepID=UPI000D677FF3|nr:hypothetical protein [Streptomyces sp. Act143]PWI17952.1 hypothetical protein DI272_30190 [Streptomyces sp. Act143]